MAQDLTIYYSKTDIRSALCLLPILPIQRNFLIMKARNPLTGQWAYFVEKALPFGASISCKRFQDFSDALKHILEFITLKKFSCTNYLDNYLFVQLTEQSCNQLVSTFLHLCQEIGRPVAEEKTEYATSIITFLGFLLNGETYHLSIPQDKVDKAMGMLRFGLSNKKVTIKMIQRLAGTLNFLNRAVIPGRVFTRGMYSKLTETDRDGNKLRQYHHVNLGSEFLEDCKVWMTFLTKIDKGHSLHRPYIDVEHMHTTTQVLYRCKFEPRSRYGGHI